MAQRFRRLAALAGVCGFAVGGVALARGLNMAPPIFGQTGGFGGFFYASAPATPSKSRRAPRRQGDAFGYGAAVCVRLCDGYFFPTHAVAGGDAACASQCPDAPTALYTMSSDNIDDAVSETGVRYSKLPVAKRYQTHFDGACTCRRDAVASRAEEVLSDTTLRRGDVVMTAEGFRVYVGGAYGPNGPEDFVALAQAGNVPSAERVELTAMEHSAAGSPLHSAPALIAKRPKGKVTVEDVRAGKR